MTILRVFPKRTSYTPTDDLAFVGPPPMIGHDMEAEEQRNREIFRAGAMPFSQFERDFSRTKTEYSAEWKAFERQWQRPAATVAHMREVEAGKDQIMIGEESI